MRVRNNPQWKKPNNQSPQLTRSMCCMLYCPASVIHLSLPAFLYTCYRNEWDIEWVAREMESKMIWLVCVMLITSCPSCFSSAAHMANEHAQYSYSDSLIQSFLQTLVPVYLLPLCPAVCLSFSLCLFKAPLYSFHFFSITLKANSQSQWAWVTRDKSNIAYNACKLHTYRCLHLTHVCWRKHIFKYSFILLSKNNKNTKKISNSTHAMYTWISISASSEVILIWSLKQFDPNSWWMLWAK